MELFKALNVIYIFQLISKYVHFSASTVRWVETFVEVCIPFLNTRDQQGGASVALIGLVHYVALGNSTGSNNFLGTSTCSELRSCLHRNEKSESLR